MSRRCAIRFRRRGTTLTETTIVLLLFLLLIFGMVDLAVLIVRTQSLAQAARCGARAAIVRGELASVLGPQGPATVTGTVADGHPLAEAMRPYLVLMDPSDVTFVAAWPNGNNREGSPVSIALSASYTPWTTVIFGRPTWRLRGSSQMPIAH